MEPIPKIIHYCWFGRGTMPDLAKRCLKSWEQYLPDYKKVEWNEDIFDINSNLFVKQAYESKKFAFVADYVRLYALYHQGGIYMDTDVEVLKKLDHFLAHPAFSGFETKDWIPTGIMGAIKGHSWIGRLLAYYHDRPFIKEDGAMDLTTNCLVISDISEKEYGWRRGNNLQVLKDGVFIYPNDYFCPKDWSSPTFPAAQLTDNSHTIHHFAGSWLQHENS